MCMGKEGGAEKGGMGNGWKQARRLMEWEKGLKGDTVGVPRQREKERTEPQTWDRAALGTLFRALGMYRLSQGPHSVH